MELMKELSLAPGVSGSEEEIAKIITRELKDVADDIETDSMGNLIATKKGDKKAPKVMLASHMDEIGLMVRYIDDNGYLCLVDFGLCKVLETKDELSTSFCGSTEYMSPEMIKGEGHNRGTDLWAFGILIYELLYGYVPFRDDKKEYLLDLITEAELRFSERKKLSKNALDFIQACFPALSP